MSQLLLYTFIMNNNCKSKPNKKNTLFTVITETADNKIFSWNFVMTSKNSISFAGKTVIIKKQGIQKIYKASQITTPPDFTIECIPLFGKTNFTYLPSQLLVSAKVEVRNCATRLDKKIFAWFSNIAGLLLAIENKDSLLAAEFFHTNANIFMQLPCTTIRLLESISVEGLFSWVWGRFDEKAMNDLRAIYEGRCSKGFEKWGVSEAFFTAARRRLQITTQNNEPVEKCIALYLKKHPGTKITLGIVGSKHYRWIEKKLYATQEKMSTIQEEILHARTSIQAESNNTFDKNALAMYIEHPETDEKVVSGYIRKTGSELLRKALPNKTFFSTRLSRLGYQQGGSTGIVVELTI